MTTQEQEAAKEADQDTEVVDLTKLNKAELIAEIETLQDEIETLQDEAERLQSHTEKLEDELDTAHGVPAGQVRQQVPDDAIVIPEDCPFFDGVARDYYAKAETVPPAALPPAGLVLAPDDPAAITALESYIVRCFDADEREKMQVVLVRFLESGISRCSDSGERGKMLEALAQLKKTMAKKK